MSKQNICKQCNKEMTADSKSTVYCSKCYDFIGFDKSKDIAIRLKKLYYYGRDILKIYEDDEDFISAERIKYDKLKKEYEEGFNAINMRCVEYRSLWLNLLIEFENGVFGEAENDKTV